jgi:hypothetical protein
LVLVAVMLTFWNITGNELFREMSDEVVVPAKTQYTGRLRQSTVALRAGQRPRANTKPVSGIEDYKVAKRKLEAGVIAAVPRNRTRHGSIRAACELKCGARSSDQHC